MVKFMLKVKVDQITSIPKKQKLWPPGFLISGMVWGTTGFSHLENSTGLMETLLSLRTAERVTEM